MKRSWTVLAVVLVSVLGVGSGIATAVGEDLVWPAAPLVLVEDGSGFTASIPVSNPSSSDVVVAAGENACAVSVKGGGVTVPAHRSIDLAVEVAPRTPDCADPADGSQALSLRAGDSSVTFPIQQTAAAPEDPKPTGLRWPDEPVFLVRTEDGLAGTFNVFNPTAAPITVTTPVFKACQQIEAPESPPTTVVAAHSAVDVAVTGPTSCSALNTRDLIVAATASAADDKKFDSHELTLRAEVDWANFKDVLRNTLLGFLAFAAIVAVVAWLKLRDEKEVGPLAPLLTANSSPSGWLSGIGTLGTVVPTLLATSGLAKGLTGVAETPQTTLVLAGSAVAIALVAVAGVVTAIPGVTRSVQGAAQSVPLQLQFLVGAALSAAAAALQFWAVRTAVVRLELVEANDAQLMWYAGIFAIVVYSALNIWHYIDRYAPEIDDEETEIEPSQELVGALVGALVIPYGQAANVPPGDREGWKAVAAKAVEDGVAAASKAVNVDGSEAQQIIVAGAPAAEFTPAAVRPRLFRNLI